ncbi:NfeD family protein [Hyphobacterium sp. HN65]|uniref:NfeD family protein n=1 Tax=Hyphobacterium lacteum TaxID=3116575 RepID=A0ABU7LN32_9PROT|nr:NfeD family protein [Hyphobacterium sp. HN65]MEE2525298.1 NfeD family protein [Hyphobacterium sp. HN65]
MDILIGFLEGLNLWWWLGIAAALLITELLTGTTYILWPAASAFVTALIASFVGWPVELFIFAGLGVAFLVLGDRFVKPRLKSGSDSGLNSRATYLVGERVTIVSAFTEGKGRVRHGDTEWAAKSHDGSDLAEGTSAIVDALDGTRLVVKA